MKFKISKEVFERFPDLVVAIPVISGFDNTIKQVEALAFLREQEQKLRSSLDIDIFWKDKRVSAYMETFRKFGVDPNKFLPAHIALAKRVLEGGSLPDINPIVNIYNAMSIKYLTPFGGEDLDKVYGDFELKIAVGGERWIPIGGGKAKYALKDELVWGDMLDLSTRALNWRQCDRTKMTTQTKNGYFVMDGFEGTNKENITVAAKEFIELMTQMFGGEGQIYWLDKDNLEFEIDHVSKTLTQEEKKKVGATSEKSKNKKLTSIRTGSSKSVLKTGPVGVLGKAIEKLELGVTNFTIEHPADRTHGDYATNIAMIVAQKLKESKKQNLKSDSPRDVAVGIVEKLKEDKELGGVFDLGRIEIAGPGFINFWLKKDWLLEELKRSVQLGDNYGRGDWNKDKKVMVEFTDPNPFKEFHIGHLMSNAIGESLARLISFGGADLRRACYQGDVGMHVAKSVWGWKKKMTDEEVTVEDLLEQTLEERVHYLGQSYAVGSAEYEKDERAKEEMNKLNKIIYEKSDKEIDELYMMGRQWSLDYFETIYQKLGTKFDYYFFESEAGDKGKKLVEEYTKKKVFEISDGAIVFKGEKHGLHTRVFLNSLGLPTYEAKELALSKMKNDKFGYDWSVVVTGNEINAYFKVLLTVMGMIYPDLAKKTTHIGHGMLRLTTGKMSSRTGKVVTGESLINDAREEIKKRSEGKVDEETNTAVAVSAIKFSVLRQSPGKDIVFDFAKSLSVEGDSGPYLLYTNARALSVLAKSKSDGELKVGELENEEVEIMRSIYQFGEVVERAAKDLTPNTVVAYLVDLAQKFNGFYNKCSILDAGEKKELRLLLTRSVSNVMKNGLWVLGIKAVERM